MSTIRGAVERQHHRRQRRNDGDQRRAARSAVELRVVVRPSGPRWSRRIDSNHRLSQLGAVCADPGVSYGSHTDAQKRGEPLDLLNLLERPHEAGIGPRSVTCEGAVYVRLRGLLDLWRRVTLPRTTVTDQAM